MDHDGNDLAGRVDCSAVLGHIPVAELLEQFERGRQAWARRQAPKPGFRPAQRAADGTAVIGGDLMADSPDFDLLFARAAPRVRLYIHARLGAQLRDSVETLDLLQETYAAGRTAERRPPGGDDEGAVRWLNRLAENRIRKLARHHGAAKRRPPGERLPVSVVLERVAAEHTGPRTAAARVETRQRLTRALDALSDDERLVVLGRHFEGRTLDDLATSLGTSPSSVRRTLGRAIARLGGLLGAPEPGA